MCVYVYFAVCYFIVQPRCKKYQTRDIKSSLEFCAEQMHADQNLNKPACS